MLGSKDRPAHVQRLLADFEITADKDLAISKTLTKIDVYKRQGVKLYTEYKIRL